MRFLLRLCIRMLALALYLYGNSLLLAAPSAEKQKIAEVEKAIREGNGNSCIPFLLDVLNQKNRSIAPGKATLLLGKIGKDAVSPLVEVLKGDNLSAQVGSLEALEAMGSVAAPAIPDLLPLLSPKEFWSLRAGAARTLGAIGPEAKAAVPLLRELLTDENASIRVETALALGLIAGERSQHMPVIIAVLDEQLKNPPATVNYSVGVAFHAVAKLAPDSQSAVPVIIKLIQSPNFGMLVIGEDSILTALNALGPLAIDAAPALEKQLTEEKLPRYKRSTIHILNSLDTRGLLPVDLAPALVRGLEGEKPLRYERSEIHTTLGYILGARYDVQAHIAKEKQEETEKWQKLCDARKKKFASVTYELPPVDRVQIVTLQEGYQDKGEPKKATFSTRLFGSSYLIISEIVLKGAQAEAIAADWRNMPFNGSEGAMCHSPVYGLRFYKGDKLLFETTVCWHCANFYVGYHLCGFDRKAPAATKLLEDLDKILPYYRAPKK